MIQAVIKVLKVLNSETHPYQISLGLCFSVVVAFTPKFSIHNLVILFLILFFRINLSAFLLGGFLFSGIGYFLDPLFHKIGLALLTAPWLDRLWTAFYNATMWRVEEFNNTVVMGSLFSALVLFIPLYFLFNKIVLYYRKHVYAHVQKLKIMKAIKGNDLYRRYQSLKDWGGLS
jgi:uncharacterized protein (TIGR03546 family)